MSSMGSPVPRRPQLVQALELRGGPAGNADASLGLAALGTIADMMPLRGENRVIVRDGLPRVRRSARAGALCEVAGIAPPPRGNDIAFAVGPRIMPRGGWRMPDWRSNSAFATIPMTRFASLSTSTPGPGCASRPRDRARGGRGAGRAGR